MKPKTLVIVGPTASGKTGVALALAERLGGEVVGADSVQVYRGFDIGSAKPTREERARVPHHLIDVVDPGHDYSAAEYAAAARAAVNDIARRGRVPLVAGGTGLYLRALFEGLMPAPGKDAGLRAGLEALTTAELRAKLTAADPAWAAKIQGEDRYRLIRALEIFSATGVPPSEWARRQAHDRPFETLWIGLAPPRGVLYDRINRRVEAMWSGGLLGEVAGLTAQGYAETRPMASVGYAEALAQLRGALPPGQAMAQAQQRTRNYAKRQGTWFRGLPAIHWFDSSQTGTVDRIQALIDPWL